MQSARSASNADERLPVRVAYIGLHPHTPVSVSRPGVRVIGMTQPDVLYRFTFNPGDLAFQLLMAAHGSRLGRVFEFLFYAAWKVLGAMCSAPYARYAGMLELAVRQRIPWMGTDSSSILRFLKKHTPDVLLINSWSILPPEIMSVAPKGAINIHPSKLPKYVGALPTLWALKNKDHASAVTFLLLCDAVDRGEVVGQFDFAIEPHDTALSIEQKVDHIIREHVHEVVMGYAHGTVEPSAQVGEESLTERYGAYRKIRWEDETAEEVFNKVQLYPYLEPYLYCYFLWRRRKVMLKDCRLSPTELETGKYLVRGGILHVGTKAGTVSAALFSDLSFLDSLRLLFSRQGLLT